MKYHKIYEFLWYLLFFNKDWGHSSKTKNKHINKNQISTKGIYNRMLAMKSKNPDMKVSLAVGGWNEGSGNSKISFPLFVSLK